MPIARHNIDLCFRVLLYQETDGAYVAHALEMDLIGQGHSPNKAITDLRHAIEAQISFAIQKKTTASLSFPAPADVIARWENAVRRNLKDLAAGDVPLRGRCLATAIEITGRELAAIRRRANRREFKPSGLERACA